MVQQQACCDVKHFIPNNWAYTFFLLQIEACHQFEMRHYKQQPLRKNEQEAKKIKWRCVVHFFPRFGEGNEEPRRKKRRKQNIDLIYKLV